MMTISTPEPEAESEHFNSAPGLPRFKAFHALYAYLVERNTALLGLRGLRFHLRIEQATTLEELQTTIGPLSEAVEKRYGLNAAKKFKRESERRIRLALAKGPD